MKNLFTVPLLAAVALAVLLPPPQQAEAQTARSGLLEPQRKMKLNQASAREGLNAPRPAAAGEFSHASLGEPDQSAYFVGDENQVDPVAFRHEASCGLGDDCCDSCCGDVCCDPCCGDVCCGDVCCDTCCDSCCPPWWAHRTGVWGEFLYLQATDADVTHAQQQNGIGGAGTVPFGIIDRADPDYEPAYRVGVDICCTSCSSIFASYTDYESNSFGSLNAPVITGGGGAVGSLVHHPGAALTASVGPVNHSYDIDFQIGDFGMRRVWHSGPCHVVNWSVGGRYGHLDQEFFQTGVFGGGQGGQVDTTTEIEFDGGGLRFGIDAERRFADTGWSVYGKALVAPMTGRFHANYEMVNQTTDIDLALANWSDDRIVTNLEYEAGLAWMSCCCHWRVTGGYTVAHWFNAVTTDSFINAVKANDYEDVNGPLAFSGLVTRVEYRW
ncbi:MAG: Lpg1974 family pore-forming outer membrane protein [Bythopirellula sp.]|nr:Lpg1974 family pore-forming outer membrane protein [Bythopirellula sp.]